MLQFPDQEWDLSAISKKEKNDAGDSSLYKYERFERVNLNVQVLI
jgi:hypothetical protein